MARRIQVLMLVGSWIIAMGVQWDVVQVVAWGRMLAGNTRTMRFADAVQKTFSGEMCGICRMVSKARQQEEQSPAREIQKGKLDLICQSTGRLIWRVSEDRDWARGMERVYSAARAEPPTPPPRLG